MNIKCVLALTEAVLNRWGTRHIVRWRTYEFMTFYSRTGVHRESVNAMRWARIMREVIMVLGLPIFTRSAPEMDEDGKGTITMTEFEHKLKDERVIAYFNAPLPR